MIENRFFDLDSLNITSVALLGCPFMPKQGPRSFKKKEEIKNVSRTGGAPGVALPPFVLRFRFFLFFIANKRSLILDP